MVQEMEAYKLNALWAKKPQTEDEPEKIVPLPKHLKDTADEAGRLYDDWLPKNLQGEIDRQMLVFLAYVHDLGKASPAFQLMKANPNTPDVNHKIISGLEKAGFYQKEYPEFEKIPHGLISYKILDRNGLGLPVGVIVGGHHGKPPTKSEVIKMRKLQPKEKIACGFNDDIWVQAQNALLENALRTSRLTKDQVMVKSISVPMQMIYSGLIMLADWIASGEEMDELPTPWLPQAIKDIFFKRFDISVPRVIQTALIEAAEVAQHPGVFIVEAPMGEGKTEAALAAAEILAHKVNLRGIYFALPSQATSNAMFARINNWIKHFDKHDGSLSIYLHHSKSELSKTFESFAVKNYISEAEDGNTVATVYDWFKGRKKGILADFVIGTIDQVLMAGLQQKHLALRHLGLANKVLIVDEYHAYDSYMDSYFLKAIKWLSDYGVPTIILSATLPVAKRKTVVEAYLKRNEDEPEGLESKLDNNWATSHEYPLITYTDGQVIHSVPIKDLAEDRNKVIEIETIEDDQLILKLNASLVNGGCAAVICNTVKKAQEVYEAIRKVFKSFTVVLLHAGFIAVDREACEETLVEALGKDASHRPEKYIVVGTQIFEQSLDIDFDVMFTQLCPVDLLLQRIGRLQRHNSIRRPKGLHSPKCYVMGTSWDDFGKDYGSSFIYGDYLLMRTVAVLPRQIHLPRDIPLLVAKVYDGESVNIPKEYDAVYQKADERHNLKINNMENRAVAFQIRDSEDRQNIIGLLDCEQRDSIGEATVRDGTDAIEVLLIQRREGELCLLPWVQNGERLSTETPPESLAKVIANCSVRLPLAFSVYNKTLDIEKTIKAIESEMCNAGIRYSWYESYWLKGTLVLILDDDKKVTIEGHTLQYDQAAGLRLVKCERFESQ